MLQGKKSDGNEWKGLKKMLNKMKIMKSLWINLFELSLIEDALGEIFLFLFSDGCRLKGLSIITLLFYEIVGEFSDVFKNNQLFCFNLFCLAMIVGKNIV